MANRTTVGSLARELFVDVDEVLLTLWDLGVHDIRDGNSTIPAKWVDKARTALGAPTVREQMRIDYWVNALGVTRSEFVSELEDLGVRVSANARRLPKGALHRLQRKYTDPAALEKTAGVKFQQRTNNGGFTCDSISLQRRGYLDLIYVIPIHPGSDRSAKGDQLPHDR